MAALKQAENKKGWIVRIFEPTGHKQKTQLNVGVGKKFSKTLTLKPFEIKTFRINTNKGSMIETNLMEEKA